MLPNAHQVSLRSARDDLCYQNSDLGIPTVRRWAAAVLFIAGLGRCLVRVLRVRTMASWNAFGRRYRRWNHRITGRSILDYAGQLATGCTQFTILCCLGELTKHIFGFVHCAVFIAHSRWHSSRVFHGGGVRDVLEQ